MSDKTSDSPGNVTSQHRPYCEAKPERTQGQAEADYGLLAGASGVGNVGERQSEGAGEDPGEGEEGYKYLERRGRQLYNVFV